MMNKPEIKVRVATPADAELLSRIGAETFADSFGADNTPEDMVAYLASAFTPELQGRELAEPGSIFLIAECDGQVAGYARLLAGHGPDFLDCERPVELVRIYARRAWIGKGVGSALMDRAIALAAENGHDVIWLGVWERNAHALSFYHRWGFVKAGKKTFLLGSDLQTDFVLKRNVP